LNTRDATLPQLVDCQAWRQEWLHVACYVQKEVAVKIMKIKPGAKQESLTELPYTEAAIAGICIHANIVQTMYSDLLPVFATEEPGSFWSKAKDDRSRRGASRSAAASAAQAAPDGVKEWQVRMVMEICDLGARLDAHVCMAHPQPSTALSVSLHDLGAWYEQSQTADASERHAYSAHVTCGLHRACLEAAPVALCHALQRMVRLSVDVCVREVCGN
jgi:hypothetical protein